MNAKTIRGLTRTEVAERVRRGEVNRTRQSHAVEYLAIVRRNLLTVFNGLVTPAAVMLFWLGNWRDGIAVSGFALLNTLVGLVQEIRAKRHLDRLAILAETKARVLLSEVCGTDVHLWHGRLDGVPYPIVPGHVNLVEILDTAGEILDVDGRRVAPGTVATFYDVHGACGRCRHCAVGRSPTRCPHRRVYGITLSARV